jgi:hypothetical protein
MTGTNQVLIRPRLTDHYGIALAQEDADFAIPFLDEDIPLYVDPFLMWRSPSQMDQALHDSLLNAFNYLGRLWLSGSRDEAVEGVVAASECDEVGLGSSRTRRGKRIGRAKAEEMLELFARVPRYATHGLSHIEELQLLVEGVSRDRVSDFACSFLKSFLIDFTTQECRKHGIPTESVTVPGVWDHRARRFFDVRADVPVDPVGSRPLMAWANASRPNAVAMPSGKKASNSSRHGQSGFADSEADPFSLTQAPQVLPFPVQDVHHMPPAHRTGEGEYIQGCPAVRRRYRRRHRGANRRALTGRSRGSP